MANISKKAIDPTEAALSAIQEALDVRDLDTAPPAPEIDHPAGPARDSARDVEIPAEAVRRSGRPAGGDTFRDDTPPLRADLGRGSMGAGTGHAKPGHNELGRAEPVRDEDAAPRRAANDDRKSIGQVLQALQRRPSRITYVVATIFALAWVFASFGVAWIFMPELQATMTSGSAAAPALIGLGAVFLIPVLFFYALAHMIWRSQELRVVAQSMAEVAIRLADPETAARDSIVTVGQAIRREVAAMGDGVERALARAAELETLVHNEVSALEHAYNNNEVRIQALLQDIATQRDTLVAQGEQVRNAITSVHLDLNQDITTVSERINERVQETAQRITRTLADKGEHITLALGHAGDTMISALSERGGELLERLQSTSEQSTSAITGATERLTSGLHFRTDHIHAEFAGIAANLQQDVSEQLMGVARSFEQSTSLVLDMMAARTQEMSGSLIENGTQISDNITARVTDANANLSAISRDFENRTETVIDTIAARTQTLAETLNSHGSRISALISGRVEDATSNLSAVTEDLERRTTFIIDTMNQRTQDMSNAILDSSARISDVIVARADDANTSLQAVSAHFEQDVDRVMGIMSARAQDIASGIVENGSDISETLAKRVEETKAAIRASGDSLLLDMTIRGGEFVSELEQSGARIAEAIIARSNEVSETFRESGDQLVHAVDSRGDAVKNMLASRLLAFEELFTHGGGELSEKITRDSTMLGSLITRHLTEFDRTVKTYGGELVEQLGQRTQDVSDAMRASIDSFDGRVSAKGEEVAQALDQRLALFEETIDSFDGRVSAKSGEVAQALDQRLARFEETIDSFDGRIGAKGGEVAQALDQRLARFEDTIDGRTQTLGDTLAARVTEIATQIIEGGHTAVAALNGRANEASATLDNQIAHFEKLLIGRTENVTSEVEARTTAAVEMLRERLQDLNHAITTNTADAERSLTALSSNVSNIITGNAGDVERALLNVSSEVARNFVGTADEIARVVGERAAEITGILDQNSGSLIAALNDKSRQFADNVTGATELALNQIESKAIVFTDTMFANSSEVARRINEASEQATSSFSATIRDMHEVTQSAIEQSKQAASTTVSDIRETHSMLSADVNALFERLREANILLQEVLSGAHENMSTLEHTMVTRVSDFVSTMEVITTRSGQSGQQVEENIARFHDVTTRVLGDLSQLSTQFESQGRNLAQAVELIDASNRRSDGVLGERKQELEALVAGLDTRTGDLEQRLRGFASLLDESLEVATGRARDIARVVSEATSGGTKMISEQYEMVRRTSEEERKRTHESMRSIYEQVSDEANAMFNQASDRFTEIVHGMKHMASEMQRELETTRGELRRGILELPEETAESAAQMRRVIVDQIEALAELNRIVARHGRGLETAETARHAAREDGVIAAASGERREAQRMSLRQPPRLEARADTGGRGDTSAARAETVNLRADYGTARADSARLDNPTPRADTRPDPRHDARLDPHSDSRPSPGEAAAASAPAAAPRRTDAPSVSPAANGRGGWLSDLLSRASRDDEETGESPERENAREPARVDDRTARHSIESLDSLSVDIARMIDHDAAAELWERYKRGERNVFTRRLYTLQGQKAFDEIRKKYRSEREFKQTVDRYISEFERLLDDVSRDDRGQVVARTYLTSETGKVYTMLAHAAGRFE